jgi:CO dehydrogenase/acetyl-CoA synthase beta subunit
MSWSKPASFLDSFRRLFPPKESVINFITEELKISGFDGLRVSYINNQVIIKTNSSVVRQEILFTLNKLEEKIKDKFPNQIISRIVLTS